MTERGLRQPELGRGAGEAPLAGDGEENEEVVHVPARQFHEPGLLVHTDFTV
jgi:hypothetical protein